MKLFKAIVDILISLTFLLMLGGFSLLVIRIALDAWSPL